DDVGPKQTQGTLDRGPAAWQHRKPECEAGGEAVHADARCVGGGSAEATLPGFRGFQGGCGEHVNGLALGALVTGESGDLLSDGMAVRRVGIGDVNDAWHARRGERKSTR